MENENLKNNNLEYFLLVKYAIENIDTIKDVYDITSKFQTTIVNITEEAHKRFDDTTALLLFNKYIGQENYFFKFKENDNFWGEFNLDFLPIDGKDFLKNEMKKITIDKINSNSAEKRLVNFRIQLFSNIKLEEKFNIVLEYIIKQFGLPNNSDVAIENSKILQESYGKDIKCWYFNKKNKGYLISFYYFNNTNGSTPYISLSIAETGV